MSECVLVSPLDWERHPDWEPLSQFFDFGIHKCERRDSNPQPLRDQILSLARMPIPPLSRVETTEVVLPRILHILAKPGVVATREIANATQGDSNVKSHFFSG